MGTITIGLYREQVDIDLDICLHDYLENINPKLCRSERDEQKLNKANYYLQKNGYYKHTYGYIDSKFLFLSSRPKTFFCRLFDYQLTWHQSQWANQKEVVERMCDIFGKRIAKIICFEGVITRSDFWLDMDLSFNRLRNSLYRPGVTVLERYKSDKRSLYYGARSNKYGVIYEKRRMKKHLDFLAKRRNKTDLSTRIEVRFLKKEVPIANYCDYLKTANLDVFGMFKTCFFSPRKLKTQKNVNQEKVASFIDSVDKEGLHFARRDHNKNRDFYRSIEPALKKISKDLNLSGRWRKKVEKTIVNDFCIYKYFGEIKHDKQEK